MAYQKIGFKNGNVLTAEQLIHMEDGIINAEKKAGAGTPGAGTPGGTGTGLPSDVGAYKYMATDGEGKWVPVDRLAWKVVEEKVVLPETSVTIESAEEPIETTVSPEAFVNGETYKVSWDGKEYNCLAYQVGANIQIGNILILDGSVGNKEPFFITDFDGKMVLFSLETGAHVISIEGPDVTIYPIPAEYLPKRIVYWNFDKKFDEMSGNYQFVMFEDKACTKPVVFSHNFVADVYNGRANIVAINTTEAKLYYPNAWYADGELVAFCYVGKDAFGSNEMVEYRIWAKVTSES